MTVQVLKGPPHDCVTDGHMISLRAAWDIETVRVTPFCELCGGIMLPSSSAVGPFAEWLMKLVEAARWAQESPPEAYEGMFK